MTTLVRFGQFSSSPVLAAARHRGLDDAQGLEIETVRVPSSPEQFAMLRDSVIDVAITSPDNVLLYATTDRNPLNEQFDLTLLRPIDHGLGLSLVTRPDIDTTDALAQASLAVDVVRSGFAFLLFRMLAVQGVDHRQMTFRELGSTPTRMQALLDGSIDGTILNAESLIMAREAGMKIWCTSADVSSAYLGTVLAVPAGFDEDLAARVLAAWKSATSWLLDAALEEVIDCLATASPALGSSSYADLVRDPMLGLLRDERVTLEALRDLADIRQRAGAYVPSEDDLARLAHA